MKPRILKILFLLSLLLNLGFSGYLVYKHQTQLSRYVYDICLAQGFPPDQCKAVARLEKESMEAQQAQVSLIQQREHALANQCKTVCKELDRKASSIPDGNNRIEELRRMGTGNDDLNVWMELSTYHLMEAGYSREQIKTYFFGNENVN
jgi:DNA-binding transcriptional MerR regulator